MPTCVEQSIQEIENAMACRLDAAYALHLALLRAWQADEAFPRVDPPCAGDRGGYAAIGREVAIALQALLRQRQHLVRSRNLIGASKSKHRRKNT